MTTLQEGHKADRRREAPPAGSARLMAANAGRGMDIRGAEADDNNAKETAGEFRSIESPFAFRRCTNCLYLSLKGGSSPSPLLCSSPFSTWPSSLSKSPPQAGALLPRCLRRCLRRFTCVLAKLVSASCHMSATHRSVCKNGSRCRYGFDHAPDGAAPAGALAGAGH